MEDYPKKMKLTEIEDFEGVNVKISEYEEDSSKYELLVLFNYDTDYFEDTVMFEIIVNKNVKLADIDLSDISNARGVEIIKMSFYEDDEITKLFIKEGWHDYKVDGDYDSRIEVLALEEDEYGYPSADEIFNDELNARLGNLEVVEY